MAEPQPRAAPVGILCALPEELTLLVEALERRSSLAGSGLEAEAGRLDGHDVVVASSGVGKVNAAISATLLADRYRCGALVLSGVAGGIADGLEIGDLVIADRVVDVDYGRQTDHERVIYQPGSLPLPDVVPTPGYRLEPEVEHRVRAATDGLGDRVHVGTIVSGDAFLASPLARDHLAATWSALAVEMEGSAVCGVADRFGIPWLVVRALSDRAGEDSSTDFSRFVTTAAAASARLVRDLLGAISPAPS